MAKLGISEFSYGFSFLHEQVNRNGGVNCVPVLPSLQQESKLGWDAKLPTKGIDYYFQFKMSDYLKGKNAKFIKNGPYKNPYYCIALHKAKRNKQHNLLYMLSQRNPYVYYVATRLRTDQAFYDACTKKSVTARSMMIPARSCGTINDSLRHFITYPDFGYEWRFHSEPRRFENAIEGEQIVSHFEKSAKDWMTIDRDFALNVYRRVEKSATGFLIADYDRLESDKAEEGNDARRIRIEIIDPKRLRYDFDDLFDSDLSELDTSEILEKASYVLTTLYGASLMIVGKKE